MTRADDPFGLARVRAAYDTAARDYVAAFGDDFDVLDLDREVLDHAVARAPNGLVVEVGCGHAPAARYLRDGGRIFVGIDASRNMLTEARARVPDLLPVVGDLHSLPMRDGAVVLVVAYYVLLYVRRDDLAAALREWRRVLAPGGVVVLATHLGTGEVVIDEFLGHAIASVGATLYSRDEIASALADSGFRIVHEARRHGLAHESQTERVYVVADSGSSV